MSTSLPPELSPRPRSQPAKAQPTRKPARTPGLTIPGMIIICLGPTAFVMLLSTWISSGIGGLPNLVFAVTSIYAAVKIQRRNLLAAVIGPPLIYSAAILLASGPINGKSGGVVINSFATLGTFLAVGAPWLFFTTITCFIIIIVRGRMGR